MSTTMAGQEYFAAIPDPIRLASEMQNKVRIWRDYASSKGLIGLWEKKLKSNYGISNGGTTSQSVTRGGSQGELSMIKVNDLHPLIQEQLVIVTSQRPAGKASAINTDSTSLKSARIGDAIAEHYMSQAGFEVKYITATAIALLCDEAYVDLFWDKTKGDPIAVDPELGKPIMSGDAVNRAHAPWNVARDPGLPVDQQKWNIISFRGNRFDFAAAYPKFSTQILSCGNDNLPQIPMNEIPDGSDGIFAHLLIADRTPALPEGRYALLIGDQIVMDNLDDDTGNPSLPYKDYPVDRITPEDVIDGPVGYAPVNDILGLEEITDALHSIIATNETTFGGQNIVGPQGADLKVTDFGKGVRYFELPPDQVDKLRPLELVRTPPEIFNYIGMLGSKKEKAVGSVSSVLTSQATQGASGSAMALIQTQAIQYNSGIQRSYFRLLSLSMTKLIGILRKYADTPRVAKLVGKTKSSGLKEFKYTGQDLNSISSIVYEMVNPASQTFGGRLTMAQDLIKAGMIKSPKQYINLVATGQIEVLTQDDEADELLILEENEWLSEGKPVSVVKTEIHADHIKSHMSVLSSPKAKQDPTLVQTVLDHIDQHKTIWQDLTLNDPGYLMATGQQPMPLPQPPMPPPPGMGPQAPGPSGAPPPAHMGKMVGGGGESPVQVKAGEVREAQLPNIAGTKEKPQIPGVTDVGA
jgi:hypothetical protein